MPLPTLVLSPELTASKTLRFQTKETQLGDGYVQTCAVGKSDGLEEWSVRSDWLNDADIQILINQLKFLRGSKPFAWQPEGADRGRVYICELFEVVQQGQLQQINATFVEFLEGECEPYRGQLIAEDEILELLAANKGFIHRFTRNQKPFLVNTSFLLTNSFQETLGRGNYFTQLSATTEGQFVAIRASMYAYEQTGDTYWRDVAIAMANAAIFYLYPIQPFPPVNWQTLDENNIVVAHWLCNLDPVPSKAPVADDPLNNGYFNLVVNFVNGVGQIPHGAPTFGEKLSNVYRVIPMNEELLWQNVYAFPRYNPQSYYEIDYWVTDISLKGLIRRFYADAQQPGGRQPLPTNEPLGLVKLIVPYTGQLKVTFSTYTGAIIPVNGLYEPYPCWRLLRPKEALAAIDTLAWSWDAYRKLWENTGNEYWYRCMYYTALTEVRAAQIENSSAWYKKYDAQDPFRHPGSQIIITPENDSRTYVATRNYGGDKNLWLKVDLTASNKSFPTVEIQNFAVQPGINTDTVVQVEAACSQATTLEVVLSLSQNAFDFTKYYICRMPVPSGNVPTVANFTSREFVKFEPKTNVWNPFIADNPIYTYKGDDGEVTVTLVKSLIDGVARDVYAINLKARGDYAGAGFVTKGIAPDLGGAAPNFPLKLFYRFERVNDGGWLYLTVNGKKYGVYLEQTQDWAIQSLEPSDLVNDDDEAPPSDGKITNIEVECNGDDRAIFYVWWIGSAAEELPAYAQTYKAAIVSKVKTAHTLWCGNFEAIGAPSNALRYVPGVNLFTVNVENGAIDSWRGSCVMAGYQDPYHLVRTEQWERLGNQLQFLEDSQNAYQQANPDRINGLFYQGFLLQFWDAVDFVDNRGYNVFTENTIDPNSEWCQYFTRPLKSTAYAWYLLVEKGMGKTKYAKQAERIVMRFLGFLFTFHRNRNSNQPPTNIRVDNGAKVLYHEPSTAALTLAASIFANLAGGNSLITFGMIKGMYEYIKSQKVTGGLMDGSFSAGQPEFTVDGVVYREYFGFWNYEIVESLSLLHKYREQIRLPNCSSPLF
jgi:phage-related protein